MPAGRRCPACPDGTLELRLSRYGPFVGCADYPACGYRRGLAAAGAEDGYTGPRDLGTDPESGLPVTLRRGPNGWYVQRGERSDTGGREKPERMSLPGSTAPGSVDLDLARRLLALPREVGMHPETGQPILAGIGRYGPWLRHEDSYAAIPADEDVLAIGLNRAVDLIADKQVRESRARGPKQVLRKLGPHPDDGAPVWLKTGHYGPFVAHRRRYASLPENLSEETLTLERAVELLDGSGAGRAGVVAGRWTAAPAVAMGARHAPRPDPSGCRSRQRPPGRKPRRSPRGAVLPGLDVRFQTRLAKRLVGLGQILHEPTEAPVLGDQRLRLLDRVRGNAPVRRPAAGTAGDDPAGTVARGALGRAVTSRLAALAKEGAQGTGPEVADLRELAPKVVPPPAELFGRGVGGHGWPRHLCDKHHTDGEACRQPIRRRLDPRRNDVHPVATYRLTRQRKTDTESDHVPALAGRCTGNCHDRRYIAIRRRPAGNEYGQFGKIRKYSAVFRRFGRMRIGESFRLR